MASYKVLERGLEWEPADGGSRRAEPGEVVDDLLESSIPGLIKDKLIEPVKPERKPHKKEARKK